MVGFLSSWVSTAAACVLITAVFLIAWVQIRHQLRFVTERNRQLHGILFILVFAAPIQARAGSERGGCRCRRGGARGAQIHVVGDVLYGRFDELRRAFEAAKVHLDVRD